MVTYAAESKRNIEIFACGDGGAIECLSQIPDDKPIFGGFKHRSGRFFTFFHAGSGVSILKRGRASMHKNGKSCCDIAFLSRTISQLTSRACDCNVRSV